MARGSVKARGNSYRVRISYQDEAGKRHQVSKTASGSNQAEKLRTQLLGELDKGILAKPSKTTIGIYLEQWLKSYVASTVAPRTHESYAYIAKKHLIPVLGNIKLCNLRPQHLQQLYGDKLQQGLSPRTVQLLHVTLHKALKNAIKTGLLSRNPLDLVDPPKVERHEMKTMTEEDISRFLNEARKGDYYSLFYIYLFTGIRRGEALSLRWSDVDLPGCQLSISKTMQCLNNKITYKSPKTANSRRLVALSPSTCVVLRLHKEAQNKIRKYKEDPSESDKESPSVSDKEDPSVSNDDLVFCQSDGKPYLPNTISHAWIKLVKRCGLDGIRLHDARHTHATLLFKSGVSAKVIQERLGHSSVAFTMNTYAHVSPGMQKQAASQFDDAVISKGLVSTVSHIDGIIKSKDTE
jgi:integrase